ncbi:MAG: hypothetical protein GX974_03955, partial [Clostridiales bacterium]|nr:hypothetical protein [Clostridiales bacterium]
KLQNKSGDYIANVQNLLNRIGDNSNNISNRDDIYIIPGKTHKGTIPVINDCNSFMTELGYNLGESGVSDEYSFDLAEYLYAIFAGGMCPLLIGYSARSVADAISYTISGESATVLMMQLGFSDYSKLISTVDNSIGKVISIEGAVENISESVYIPLIKNSTDKFLIFSMESISRMEILPDFILNYILPIDLDLIIDYKKPDELYYSKTDKSIFNTNIGQDQCRRIFNDLGRLDEFITLSNACKLRLSKIIGIIDNIGVNRGMYSALLFTLNGLCTSHESRERLKNFINIQTFNPQTLRKIMVKLEDELINA